MGHVWLTGMMGTGKSTVGGLVAELLRRPLVDIDAEVMERTGRTIPELFEESEAAFRDMEREVIVDVSALPDAVIATGGGAILDQRNVERMASTGSIVLLAAHPAELARRVAGDDSRPLLQAPSDLARIGAEREARYLEACDHVIDTTDKAPDQVAREVVECIGT